MRSLDDPHQYLEGVRRLIVDGHQDLVGLRTLTLSRVVDAFDRACGVTGSPIPRRRSTASRRTTRAAAGSDVAFADDFADGLSPTLSADGGPSHRSARTPVDLSGGSLGRPSARGGRLEEYARRDSGRAERLDVEGDAAVKSAPRDRLCSTAAVRRLTDLVLETGDCGRICTASASGLLAMILSVGRADVLATSSRPPSEATFRERWGGAWPSWLRMTCDGAWESSCDSRGCAATASTWRRCVSLARAQPPLELVVPDHGVAGPVVGTIHAAKGRGGRRAAVSAPPARNGAPLAGASRCCSSGPRERDASAKAGLFRLSAHSVRRRPALVARHQDSGWRAVQVEVGRDGTWMCCCPCAEGLADAGVRARGAAEDRGPFGQAVCPFLERVRQTNWQHVLWIPKCR